MAWNQRTSLTHKIKWPETKQLHYKKIVTCTRYSRYIFAFAVDMYKMAWNQKTSLIPQQVEQHLLIKIYASSSNYHTKSIHTNIYITLHKLIFIKAQPHTLCFPLAPPLLQTRSLNSFQTLFDAFNLPNLLRTSYIYLFIFQIIINLRGGIQLRGGNNYSLALQLSTYKKNKFTTSNAYQFTRGC